MLNFFSCISRYVVALIRVAFSQIWPLHLRRRGDSRSRTSRRSTPCTWGATVALAHPGLAAMHPASTSPGLTMPPRTKPPCSTPSRRRQHPHGTLTCPLLAQRPRAAQVRLRSSTGAQCISADLRRTVARHAVSGARSSFRATLRRRPHTKAPVPSRPSRATSRTRRRGPCAKSPPVAEIYWLNTRRGALFDALRARRDAAAKSLCRLRRNTSWSAGSSQSSAARAARCTLAPRSPTTSNTAWRRSFRARWAVGRYCGGETCRSTCATRLCHTCRVSTGRTTSPAVAAPPCKALRASGMLSTLLTRQPSCTLCSCSCCGRETTSCTALKPRLSRPTRRCATQR